MANQLISFPCKDVQEIKMLAAVYDVKCTCGYQWSLAIPIPAITSAINECPKCQAQYSCNLSQLMEMHIDPKNPKFPDLIQIVSGKTS